MEQKEIIYILCEGNSEVNYMTRLNKFLDNDYNLATSTHSRIEVLPTNYYFKK